MLFPHPKLLCSENGYPGGKACNHRNKQIVNRGSCGNRFSTRFLSLLPTTKFRSDSSILQLPHPDPENLLCMRTLRHHTGSPELNIMPPDSAPSRNASTICFVLPFERGLPFNTKIRITVTSKFHCYFRFSPKNCPSLSKGIASFPPPSYRSVWTASGMIRSSLLSV